MDLSLAVAILSLLVTLGVHLIRGGRGDGQQEEKIRALEDILRLQARQRELKDEYFDHEIGRLRDWRHNKVGESPGLAAMQKAEEVERRLERVERKIFNGTRENS